MVACRLGPSNPLRKPSGSPSQSKKVADELGSISPHNVNIHVLLAGENASTYSSLLTARLLLLIFVLPSCNSFWLFLALSSTTVPSADILDLAFDKYRLACVRKPGTLHTDILRFRKGSLHDHISINISSYNSSIITSLVVDTIWDSPPRVCRRSSTTRSPPHVDVTAYLPPQPPPSAARATNAKPLCLYSPNTTPPRDCPAS